MFDLWASGKKSANYCNVCRRKTKQPQTRAADHFMVPQALWDFVQLCDTEQAKDQSDMHKIKAAGRRRWDELHMHRASTMDTTWNESQTIFLKTFPLSNKNIEIVYTARVEIWSTKLMSE